MWTFRLVIQVGLLCVIALAIMGAGPLQKGVPPQPYKADYFSGTVFLGSQPAPAGMHLVACVDECSVFETEVVVLNASGSYSALAVHPEDERLRGREIGFYIVNQYGRIKAAETTFFEGGFNIAKLDLHFNDPLPVPPAPAVLPRVGDPMVPNLPKVALLSGSVAIAAGLLLMLACRRRRALFQK